jgi:hypothetical protein
VAAGDVVNAAWFLSVGAARPSVSNDEGGVDEQDMKKWGSEDMVD